MALNVPHERTLRGNADLAALVRAVVAAGEHDESDSVEWKGSGLDLSAKAGRFAVARAILGLANRDPEGAALTFGGCGYIAVGVEPGHLGGVKTLDPAEWIPGVERYTGGQGGPRWSPTYVSVDSSTVLVVTVEPPEPGHPIWLLRSGHDGARPGTVYVRKHGRTDQADASDMDILQARLMTSQGPVPEFKVEVLGDGLPWLNRSVIEAQARDAAHAYAAELIAQAEQHETARGGILEDLGLGAALAKFQADQILTGLMPTYGPRPDTRTLADYRVEVQNWESEWVAAVLDHAEKLAAAQGPIRIRVSNPTELFLRDVEIEIRFDNCESFDDVDFGEDYPLPDVPHTFGEDVEQENPLLGIDFRFGFDGQGRTEMLPQTAIRRTRVRSGDVLCLQAGDMRPYAVVETDEDEQLFLVLTEATEGIQAVTGRWTATIRDRDGLVQGTVEVPVRQAPLTLGDLLAVLEDD